MQELPTHEQTQNVPEHQGDGCKQRGKIRRRWISSATTDTEHRQIRNILNGARHTPDEEIARAGLYLAHRIPYICATRAQI